MLVSRCCSARRVRWLETPYGRVLLVLLFTACAARQSVLEQPERPHVDVVMIPGCPTEDDGSLSTCLIDRIVWGAMVWEAGIADEVIVSGAATYNRYAEARALAAGLAALGVPAEHIWLEESARHTDENVYYSLLLTVRIGRDSFAIASAAGQAPGACSMARSWWYACVAIPMENERVRAALAGDPRYAVLKSVRVDPEPDGWLPVDEFEEAREAAGGRGRPSSYLVYYVIGPFKRLMGDPWIPPPPAALVEKRWSDDLAR
jgi:hypothetical protein